MYGCPVHLPSQEQPKIIEPLDYEAVVFQRKAQIHSDPHRDLLLCPVDDVSVSLLISSYSGHLSKQQQSQPKVFQLSYTAVLLIFRHFFWLFYSLIRFKS